MHYQTKYLYHHDGVGSDSNSFIKTDYGYVIKRMTNFISTHRTKLYIYADGFAKAVTKSSKNYCANWQSTTYFNRQGHEVMDKDNSTRKELATWKKLRQANNPLI